MILGTDIEQENSSNQSNNATLYHYTSPEGLRGIIERKTLWAGDVWFMNDSREALYGLEFMCETLRDYRPASAVEEKVRSQTLGLLRDVEQNTDRLPRSYIACLSRKKNQLSQWRAYGRPRGFSVGFDYGDLEGDTHLLSSPGLSPSLRDVVYKRKQQRDMFQGIFDAAVTDTQRFIDETIAAVDLANGFLVDALALATSFKDRAFEEEEEVRIQLFTGGPAQESADLKFRDGAMGLTPYVEIQLAPPGATIIPALREIIVGPQSNEAETLRAVRQLLAKNGYDEVDVQPSNVPLR